MINILNSLILDLILFSLCLHKSNPYNTFKKSTFMNLEKEAKKINRILAAKREEISLSFIEEDHQYFMKDKFGVISSNYPSVSNVVKNYYEEFDAQKMSGIMSKGDEVKQEELLKLWKEKGEYAANMGSRVHYFLEKFLIDASNNPKEIREPFFECDDERIKKSEKMILAGKSFVRLMQKRNAVLLDTELVLGDCSLGYVGQPDKVWLVENKQGTDYGFLITDWKTNNPENFKPQRFTKKMLAPFDTLDSTALGHYSLQLPLYGRLLCKMLEGTDFESKKMLGAIVVLLKEDQFFEEFKISKEIYSKVWGLDTAKP